MRSEQAIRALRDDIRRVVAIPCTCNNPIAHAICMATREAHDRTIRLLSWVLDEDADLDRWVEEVAAAARS